MSNLPGNLHATDAIDWASDVPVHSREGMFEHAGMSAQLGQIEATLALAYEQRTATLVQALLSDSLVTDGKYDEIQAEVRKRLGLGDNK